MTLTSEQRRRAVERMARAIAEDDCCLVDPVNCASRGGCVCMSGAKAAFTALLTVADVTMKETENG